jgi:uncharacterized protein (TIRG00374 family)
MKPKLNSQSPSLHAGPILLITALSLALNLHALAGDSFWGDEILTASFASLSPLEVVRWTAGDIHPPLYYLISGTFTNFTAPLGTIDRPNPVTDWLWRFPSVLAAVLAVPVTYNLAIQFSRISAPRSGFSAQHRRIIATTAALLLSMAPIAVKYGQEARMHALFMLLSALSAWLFFRALARPRQWTRWLAFALVTTANLYTMYFGFIVLATQAGYLLFSSLHPLQERSRAMIMSDPQRSRLTGFVISVGLAFVLYLPWWPVLYDIVRRRALVGAIEGGVGQPTDFVVGVVSALGPASGYVAWGFILLFLTGLVFLARHYWPLAVFASLWLILPVALPIVIGDPRALQFRYAFVLPVYLTVIAYAVGSISIGLDRVLSPARPSPVAIYLAWLLATVSFISLQSIYNQTKPDWRGAASYLNAHVAPSDIILIGPLWDEGRFIGYYYRGAGQLLTPAAMVANIQGRAEGLRQGGGRVWAANRFAPAESAAAKNVVFSGVVVSEPQIAVYEPEPLTDVAIDLAAQAVDAAYPWAAQSEAAGVLNPDPRTAQAAALRAWGDTLMAAGRPEEALAPYRQAVDIFPGWTSGFIALAEAHEAVGNVPDAVEAYRQAVAFNLLRIVISISLLILIFNSLQFDIFLEVLKRANPWFLLAALALIMVGVVVRAYRWQILLNAIEVRVSLIELTAIYLIGFLFNNILPSGLGGDAIRMIELNRYTQRGSDAVTSVIVDRYLGLLGLQAIALIALIFSWGAVPVAVAYFTILMFTGGLIAGILLISRPLYLSLRAKIGLFRKLTDIKMIGNLFESFQQYPLPAIAQAFMVALLFNVLWIGANYLIGLALGAEATLGQYAVFIPITSLVLIIPISFAGLGVREGAYRELFGQVGVPAETAVAISALYRREDKTYSYDQGRAAN